MCVVYRGKFCRLTTFLSYQSSIIDLCYLHSHTQGRILAPRQVVGAEFRQQILSDGLQIVIVAPFLDKLVQIRIDIGSLSIATGRHQVVTTIDAPLKSLSVVTPGILIIIVGSLFTLTTHLQKSRTVKEDQRTQRLHLFLYHLRLFLVERHQRIHAIHPYASLVQMMVELTEGDILQSLNTRCNRSAGRVVRRAKHPLVSLVIAFPCIVKTFQHHLRVAQAQIERLHLYGASRTVHVLQLIYQPKGGTHRVIIVAIGSQHDNEVGTCVYILPKIFSGGIVYSYDTTEHLYTFVCLSQLKIGHATIAVGTYRREFSCLSQTISHSKEIIEIAREPGGKSNTIATCTFQFVGNVALHLTIFSTTSRKHQRCHNGHYTYYIFVS